MYKSTLIYASFLFIIICVYGHKISANIDKKKSIFVFQATKINKYKQILHNECLFEDFWDLLQIKETNLKSFEEAAQVS